MPGPQVTHDGRLGFLGMLLDDPCRSSSAEHVLAKTADYGDMQYQIRSILCKGIASDGYMHKVVFTSEVCTWPRLVKVFVSKFRARVPCPMSALNTLLEAGEPGGHAETRLARPSPQVCSGRTCNMCPPPLARPELLWLARLPASSGTPSTVLTLLI